MALLGCLGASPAIHLRSCTFCLRLAILLHELGDEACPSGLVRRSQPGAVVSMEVLVEEHEIFPIWVGLKQRVAAMRWTASVGIEQEQARETIGELTRHLPKIEKVAGACGTLDLHSLTVVMVIALQRLDDEKVNRKPNWAAPVRVSAKQIVSRFSRLVIDHMLLTCDLHAEGLITMKF